MESTGIGRPSTYNTTVDTLKKRGYITIEKKAVHCTELGMALNDKLLQKYFPSIINETYTSSMEDKLDDIANGTLSKTKFLETFWKFFEPLLLQAARELNKDKEKPKEVGKKCPECGRELVIRKGKFGEFICCSGFPKCRHTEKIVDQNATKKEVNHTGIKCNVCGTGFLVERTSKKGEVFYGCSCFPKCKNTMKKDIFEKFKTEIENREE